MNSSASVRRSGGAPTVPPPSRGRCWPRPPDRRRQASPTEGGARARGRSSPPGQVHRHRHQQRQAERSHQQAGHRGLLPSPSRETTAPKATSRPPQARQRRFVRSPLITVTTSATPMATSIQKGGDQAMPAPSRGPRGWRRAPTGGARPRRGPRRATPRPAGRIEPAPISQLQKTASAGTKRANGAKPRPAVPRHQPAGGPTPPRPRGGPGKKSRKNRPRMAPSAIKAGR